MEKQEEENVDDNLAPRELELLTESFKEALEIKDGIKKGIPVSELWND